MSKINEIIVSAVLPAVKGVVKAQVSDLLDGIKDHNDAETFATLIKSTHSTFKLLKEGAKKTKTKIDDSIVDLFIEIAEEKADENDIDI